MMDAGNFWRGRQAGKSVHPRPASFLEHHIHVERYDGQLSSVHHDMILFVSIVSFHAQEFCCLPDFPGRKV